MENLLKKITIRGFQSIRELEKLELGALNIVVGANGAGKSNLLQFFHLLQAINKNELEEFIREFGNVNDILYMGRKATEKIHCTLELFYNDDLLNLEFDLLPSPDNRLILRLKDKKLEDSAIGATTLLGLFIGAMTNKGKGAAIGAFTGAAIGHQINESNQSQINSGIKKSKEIIDTNISLWGIYHFHDTGSRAGMRNYEIVQDHKRLRKDAANLAPFLLRLKTEEAEVYKKIVDTIQLVMPFFRDFLLEPEKQGPAEMVNLSWRQKGSDYPMQPYHLSDGSLRFICLATALLQPDPPPMIVIDEPELGLHPAAIGLLAELLQIASQHTQILLATQSPQLIDHFTVEDIIVCKQQDGASTFERLNPDDFAHWLEDYSLGELWVKNVIAGGPSYE